ncbi:MAG: hypothetical protein M3R36_17130 [Bacteroidota bacterium]|nr:hypothetical protein [Bacteroidota bacterium]
MFKPIRTDSSGNWISFNGSRLSSWIYLYKIESGNFKQVRQMVLIK